MENYKLVNSLEVKLKAERLGYRNDGTRYIEKDPFFFTHKDEGGSYQSYISYSGMPEFTEITQKDFLALPEPLEIGDWVKCGDSVSFFIGRIDKIDVGEFEVDTMNESFNISGWDIVKLTKEQIKILGLEE